MPTKFFELTQAELADWFKKNNIPAFQAEHAFRGLYAKPVLGWQGLTTLPKNLRPVLEAEIPARIPRPVQVQSSQDGTQKILSALDDAQTIESVWIPTRNRMTVCVSTQVGCKLNCKFCQTGQGGFFRNLDTAEIVGQLVGQSAKPTHIVFMGMGEPLDNLEALSKAIDVIHEPLGLGLGWRRMTISTVGLIPQMQTLSDRYPAINWAISLHSMDDTTRTKIMPINKKYSINQVVDAAGALFRRTSRRVSFEWVCLKDVNDRDEDLRSLVTLLAGEPGFHLNLLPYHPTTSSLFKSSSMERIRFIERQLVTQRCHVSVRESRGLDIDSACGQLRVREIQSAL